MAGPVEPEPKPDLGLKHTVAGLIFAGAILTGFGAATAASYDNADSSYDSEYDSDYGDDAYEDDHADEEHADE